MRAALAAALLCSCLGVLAQEPPDPAERLVQQIDRIREPVIDPARISEAGYLARIQSDTREILKTRGQLVMTLTRQKPDHPRVGSLLDQHWGDVERMIEKPEDRGLYYTAALQQIDEVLALLPEGYTELDRGVAWPPLDILAPAEYWRAVFRLRMEEGSPQAKLAHVQEFVKKVPADRSRGIALYSQLAFEAPSDEEALVFLKALLAAWPQDPDLAPYQGMANRIEAKGKPFPLQIKDLLKGKSVTAESLKGKVVLVEFFSPTLETSVSRIALLKMLRKELGPKGLEVVSVSMDGDDVSGSMGPGRPTLKGKALFSAWADEHKVDWPVAWTGSKGQLDWVNRWGVVGIPTVFVLDRQGRLRISSLPVNLKGELEALLAEK